MHRDRDDHHPGAGQELRRDHDHGDDEGRRGADAVQDGAPAPAGPARAQPVAHHPGLRERERREHADHVEVDQRVDVRAKREHEARRGAGEHENPVRVGEPVAEVDELPRQEAVARQQRGQPREALVRGVRGEHEDRERERLDEVVDGRAGRAGGEGRAGDLREDGCGPARARVHLHGEVRDAEEEADRRPPAISSSVRAAFRDCGWRKAVTPFEIDSTPVRAAEPDANAFSSDEQAEGARAGWERMRDRGASGTCRRCTCRCRRRASRT